MSRLRTYTDCTHLTPAKDIHMTVLRTRGYSPYISYTDRNDCRTYVGYEQYNQQSAAQVVENIIRLRLKPRSERPVGILHQLYYYELAHWLTPAKSLQYMVPSGETTYWIVEPTGTYTLLETRTIPLTVEFTTEWIIRSFILSSGTYHLLCTLLTSELY